MTSFYTNNSTRIGRDSSGKLRRRGPSKFCLCAVYMLSFFATSIWLVSQYKHDLLLARLHKKRRKRSSISISDFLDNSERPGSTKRQRPPVSPRDFTDNKLLQHGDAPYQFGPWDGAPIVLERYKLLFWTTPKVACTIFKQLFRRIEGYKDWKEVNGDVPHRPGTNGLNYLYHYRPSEADAMLTDPSWTRAIFVRDPKERLLSAYLDKVMTNHSFYVRKHCCNIPSLEPVLQCDLFKSSPSSDSLKDPAVTFTGFLTDVYSNCSDPHWKPQASRMPRKYWKYMNFVGHLDPKRIQKDTKQLLQKIGAWEQFGAVGWPSGSIFADNMARHATFAQKQLKDYYTVDLEQRVETIHQMDYQHPMLNLTMEKYS